MAIHHRLIDWFTGAFLGYVKVRSLELVPAPIELVDITVEGTHEFYARGSGAWLRAHNCLICDDLISEQALLSGNPDNAFSSAWEYVQLGPVQRLMPGGRIIMIGTRWGRRDPIGRALQWAEDNPDSPAWNEVRFPAILPSGKSLWPSQWPVEQLLAKKASMQTQFWAAQYMQEPTSEEGAIIKREWWRIWEKDEPPEVEYIIQTWDTAHEAKTSADFSACTTFGIFHREDTGANLILLNAVKGRWEFPELKRKALEQYKDWNPEALIVEKKAAGAPLIQELRRMGLVVHETTPSRGSAQVSNDKRARINSIADIFFSGKVWAPDKRWAHEVIEELASYPNGDHDDFCDCVQIAVARYRNGGFIKIDVDYDDSDQIRLPRKGYY